MKRWFTVFAAVAVWATLFCGRVAAEEVPYYYIAVIHPDAGDERYACAFSAIGISRKDFVAPKLETLPETPPDGGEWGIFRFACWFSATQNLQEGYWVRLVWFEFLPEPHGFINVGFRTDGGCDETRRVSVTSYAEVRQAALCMVHFGRACTVEELQ